MYAYVELLAGGDGWMDGWMDGWRDGWMGLYLKMNEGPFPLDWPT